MSTNLSVEEVAKFVPTAEKVKEEARLINEGFVAIDEEVNGTIGTSTFNGNRAEGFRREWKNFAEAFAPTVADIQHVGNKVIEIYNELMKYNQ